jgi:hypothetical protein
VTNPDDVLYAGAKPVVEQYGPYHYQEKVSFSSQQYGELSDLEGAKHKAVTFGRSKTFEKIASTEDDSDFETPITVMNQAFQSAWSSEANMPQWKFGLTTLFNVGVEGLGAQVLSASVANLFLKDYLASGEDGITTYFLFRNKPTDA